MRTTLGKADLLALLSVFAFVGPMAIISQAQARQVSPADIMPEQATFIANAVAAAGSVDSTARATLLNTYPKLATPTGDAVASALNASRPNSTNISNALVENGNAGLVSGVLLAVNGNAHNGVISSLANGGNTQLIVTVQNTVGSQLSANAASNLGPAAKSAYQAWFLNGRSINLTATTTIVVISPTINVTSMQPKIDPATRGAQLTTGKRD